MAEAFSIEVDASKIEARLARIPFAVRSALRGVIIQDTRELAQRVRTKLSGEVLQKRSGKLYNSVQSELVEDPQHLFGVVSAGKGVPYARIQEFGGVTRAHDIVAKNGKTLAFMMGGQMRFFKRVHHPGSKIPQRSYMASSLAEMRDKIVDDMKRAVSQAAATA